MLRIFALCLVMAVVQVHAQPVAGDTFEVLNVTAGQAIEDPDSEILLFSGSLRLETREWTLDADTAVVYGPPNRPDRVLLEGSPVRLQTRGDPDRELEALEASAPVMEYARERGSLVLSGGAVMRQDRQVIHSEVIEYDIEPGRFRARGDGGVLIEVSPDG